MNSPNVVVAVEGVVMLGFDIMGYEEDVAHLVSSRPANR